VLQSLGRVQDAEVLIATLEDPAQLTSLVPELRGRISTLEKAAMLKAAEKVRSSWAQFKNAGGGVI